MTSDFQKHGLPLHTVRLGRLGPAHARAVLERRLEHFALAGRARATLTNDAYEWLAATFGDDLRATIALLYEVFQTLRDPEAVTATHVRAGPPSPSGRGLG